MRRVDDETYWRLYLREQAQRIVEAEAWAAREHSRLWHVRTKPAAVKGDDQRADLWRRYARGYPGGLKAVQADGTERAWSPEQLGGTER